jgi:hypothetical protein
MNFKTLKTLDELPDRIFKFISKEDLTKLSEEHRCPHYRLQNPLTKEEFKLYDSIEIYDWVSKECRYSPPAYETAVNLYKYTLDRRGSYVIPNELIGVKNLLYLPFQEIMTPPGIYFLVSESKLVYIGQACNVLDRILTHVNEGVKKFDEAFFIPIPVEQLDKVERSLINFYRPEYNKSVGPFTAEMNEMVLQHVQQY